MRRPFLAALALLPLSACAVGPDYQRPPAPSGTAQPFAGVSATPAVSQEPLTGSWWRLFQDPVLDGLVAQALAHNTDLRVAEANVRQARAVLSEARAGRLPTTGINTSASRSRSTAVGGTLVPDPTGATPGSIASRPVTTTSNYYSAGFDASYELDLFGGIGRRIEAARADAEATEAALNVARVSVVAETARSYALACGYEAQANVARETLALQERTLDLTQRLLTGGRGTRREVDQAAVLAEQARAQVPQFEAERQASLASLAVLTGQAPSQLDATARACTASPRVRSVIPVGDGAELIRRRPDVLQAERRLASATAEIGIETAELYPHISLGGSAGIGARRIGDLGKSSSFTYSLGPLISWSFPNIAVARARIRGARAGADAALANFDGAVLVALEEAEQALARYAGQLDRNAALARAEQASSDAARLSRIRFDAGADSFLQLIDAERDRAAARAALADSDVAVADAQVSLFKALGGGWEIAPSPSPRPASAAK